MRLTPALIVVLALLAGQASADQPRYIDDLAIKASIESQARKLHDAGKTTDNKTLQKQLAERKFYNAAPPKPATLTQDAKDIYSKALDGVLVVSGLYLCGKCDKLHAGNASGYVISEDGLAVTNHHVVESTKNKTLVARLSDGRVVPVVEVLASNKADDVALIRLGGKEFKPVPLARSAKVGERVHAITHPYGRFYHYNSGEVSRFFVYRKGRQAIKRVDVSLDYAKGSSGGPIFNDRGQVVAMVSSTSSLYAQPKTQKNMQMVIHNCVPYESILKLFKPEKKKQAKAEAKTKKG